MHLLCHGEPTSMQFISAEGIANCRKFPLMFNFFARSLVRSFAPPRLTPLVQARVASSVFVSFRFVISLSLLLVSHRALLQDCIL